MSARVRAVLPFRLSRCASAAVVLAASWAAAPGGAWAEPTDEVLVVQTVPPTAGARIAAEGTVVRTDERGIARLPVRNVSALDRRFHVPETRVSADRKVILDRIVGKPSTAVGRRPLVVGLRTERLVHWSFADRGGREVSQRRVSLLELRGTTGEVVSLHGADLVRPLWVAGGRTQQVSTGLVDKPISWSVSRVVVDGADVVNRGQQVFTPATSLQWTIQLLFFRVEVLGRDLLFGGRSGEGVSLTRPDGVQVTHQFHDGAVVLDSVPRGTYQMRIFGGGASFTRPVSISKDQRLEIEVITRTDLILIASSVSLFALSLLLVGRREHLLRLHGRTVRWWTGRAGRVAAVVAVVLATAASLTVGVSDARADTGDDASTPPTFAYYYIWYQPTSWLRAKTDYPLLGRYSSGDPVVVRQHVEMARAAGLNGFLVSWKGRPDLDERLDTLVGVARNSGFKLAIVYQGLDFDRNTLPVRQVADDLESLAERYGQDPVFDEFGAPVVVLTGSEDYSVRQLRRIVAPVKDRLQVLASAKNVEDWNRVSGVLDGNAYYWSSADPRRAFYSEKLRQMGAAVHRQRGLWFAPAAPGFDARLIGGEQVIPRRDGATLRKSLAVARRSNPDAVAVISWNEFSENSHVEPSEKYGARSLHALANALGGSVWLPPGVGDRVPREGSPGLTGWGALLGLLLGATVLNLSLLLRRKRPPEGSQPFRHLPPRSPGPGTEDGSTSHTHMERTSR